MLVFFVQLCACGCVSVCELWSTGREGCRALVAQGYLCEKKIALLNLWVIWSHARLGGMMSSYLSSAKGSESDLKFCFGFFDDALALPGRLWCFSPGVINQTPCARFSQLSINQSGRSVP